VNGRNKLCVALFIALATTSSPARAQTPAGGDTTRDAPRDTTRADALFQEGKALFEQGRFDEACTRLAQSDAVDPTVSTIGLLAGCHEQQGRTATAWREYRATAKRAEAAGDSRAEFARQRADALEPLLPRLLVRLTSPSPDVEIFRNLDRVPAEEIGTEIAIDPGAYEIIARAPRRQEFRMTITVREGSKIVVDVPDLRSSGVESAVAPAPRPPPIVPPKSTIEVKPKPPPKAANEGAGSGMSSARISAVAVAGVAGLAGMGLGAMFGMSAVSKSNESTIIQATCRTPAECAKGRELRDGAYSASTAATVSFGLGAVGFGVGLVILLFPSGTEDAADARPESSPKPNSRAATTSIRIAPTASSDGGGAVVFGRF
jgi:hypothetical protein